jgi:hypothetical protein
MLNTWNYQNGFLICSLTDGSTGMLAEETQIDSIEMVSIGSVILVIINNFPFT